MSIKVLGLCGSLRKGSFNRMLLETARDLAPDGMTIETFEDLRAIPPYDDDVYQNAFPEVVNDLRTRLNEADGLLVATPEYNHGMPGVLKNAIDWASRPPEQPFGGKPAAVLGASPGPFGTAYAQKDARAVLSVLDARVMNTPGVLIMGAGDKFADGRLTDETGRDFLAKMLGAFKDWIALHGQDG